MLNVRENSYEENYLNDGSYVLFLGSSHDSIRTFSDQWRVMFVELGLIIIATTSKKYRPRLYE